MKRTQIYLEESQDAELASRAAATGTTKSDLIREAVDAFLGSDTDEERRLRSFKDAVRSLSGTLSRLPRGDRYVDEIRAADVERERDLERQRRR